MKKEIARIAKYWRFSGALGRVALTVGAPSSLAAASLIWTGTTAPGAIAAVSIVFILALVAGGMIWFADRHPESVLEGSDLVQVIQMKGEAPQIASAPVETIESVPVIEALQAPQEVLAIAEHVEAERIEEP